MNTSHQSSRRHARLAARIPAATSICLLALASLAHAADDTWTGATDGDWSVDTNWVTAAPGATTGVTNADTALFNTDPANKVITIDAGRNLKFITFDTASVGSYTIGGAGANAGNALQLSANSIISLTATVADGVNQTFNAPLVLNGAARFENLSVGTAGYTFAGNISANTTNSQLTIITAGTGTPTGSNLFSGNLTNGTHTLSVHIGQYSGGTGVGTVEFTGTNSYSGLTTVNFAEKKPVGVGQLITSGTNSSNGDTLIQHGTLTLNNADNGGIARGKLTLFGGGFLRANIAAAGTLSNEVSQTNSFTVTGDHSITFNGNFTNATAINRPLTNTIVAGKALTMNGNVYLSDASGTGRVWQLRGSGATVINGDIMDYNGGKGTAASGLDFGTSGTGDRSLTLAGAATYSGNTILGGGTSTVFTLAETGSMTFYIGADGVNNMVTGSATANFNGSFNFDLSGADLTAGNSWLIVDVATVIESFAGSFAVNGFSDIDNDNIWTNDSGFSFDESSGILSYTAIPEPAAFAVLAALSGLLVASTRRRRRSA